MQRRSREATADRDTITPVRTAFLACLLVGCGGGGSPDIVGLTDRVAIVGQELVMELNGTDPDGDRLTYDVSADVELEGRAAISQTPSGSGVFRWTPIASDVGDHAFDFTVSDGDNTTTVPAQIEVRATADGLPVFVSPAGSGRVVNTSVEMCIDVAIEIADQDTADVTIAEEAPLIDGATLSQSDGHNATWHWCPTQAQIADTDRYTLTLSADDNDNPKQTKSYVIVVGNMGGGPSKLIINEIDYDDSSATQDASEYIELLNVTSSTLSLAGVKLALVNGANNTIYGTYDLSSVGSLAAGQYLVLAQTLVVVPATQKRINFPAATDQLQNGAPDGLLVYDDVTHVVLDALSYEGPITAAVIPGFAAPVSLVEGTALDAAVYDANGVIRTMCRQPNGSDTGDANTDWKLCNSRSVGAVNKP
jgi:hypothetical protein